MNDVKLAVAIAEAERFLNRAKPLLKAVDEDAVAVRLHNSKPHAPNERRYTQSFPVERGAVKRASMDLTRALADLRRPG